MRHRKSRLIIPAALAVSTLTAAAGVGLLACQGATPPEQAECFCELVDAGADAEHMTSACDGGSADPRFSDPDWSCEQFA